MLGFKWKATKILEEQNLRLFSYSSIRLKVYEKDEKDVVKLTKILWNPQERKGHETT